MKRMLLLGLVLLLAGAFLPGATVTASTLPCSVSPASGPIGTTFVVTCVGLAPGEYSTAWITQPDGTAEAFTGAKADSSGTVGYAIPMSGSVYWRPSVGNWGFTVEQGGLMGVVHFTVTGGTTDVAGALLTANGQMVSGTGFAPGEPVSVWFEFPNGDCSSITAHFDTSPFNFDYYYGESIEIYDTLKADGAGNIGFLFDPRLGGYSWGKYPVPCLGNYKVVARGVDSGLGAWTTVLFEGNSVTETAMLTANKSSVGAFMDSIAFSGTGFGAGEGVNCWLTSPQGSAVPVFDAPNKADGGGSFGFAITTGGLASSSHWGFGPFSEGALGQWAMTCEGLDTGALGIARFTVDGYLVDP